MTADDEASVIRIVYDDQPDEVVDKVSDALARLSGISLVDDGEMHEGFCLYRIVGAEAAPQVTDRRPTEMKVYVDGLRHAARLREHPLLEQNPTANAYTHGYFTALDDVLRAFLSNSELNSVEARRWLTMIQALVIQISGAATAPVDPDVCVCEVSP